MSLGTFQIGQQVVITATFRNAADALTDPTVISWRILHEDGTIDTYTQASSEVAHLSTGVFALTYTIAANNPRSLVVETKGTLGLITADEEDFVVERSAFVTP